MSGMKIADVLLVTAPGEPGPTDIALAADIARFEAALGPNSSRRNAQCFSGNAPALFAWAGDYLVPIVAASASAFVTATGLWLQARAGRKVSLRIGDVEATASSVEDVERLLVKAKLFQAVKTDEQA